MGHSRTLNWGSHCLLLLDFCRQSRSLGKVRAELLTVLPIAYTRKRQNSISPNSAKPFWSEIKDQASLCGFPFSGAEQISPSKVWAESPLLQQKQVNFLTMGACKWSLNLLIFILSSQGSPSRSLFWEQEGKARENLQLCFSLSPKLMVFLLSSAQKKEAGEEEGKISQRTQFFDGRGMDGLAGRDKLGLVMRREESPESLQHFSHPGQLRHSLVARTPANPKMQSVGGDDN